VGAAEYVRAVANLIPGHPHRLKYRPQNSRRIVRPNADTYCMRNLPICIITLLVLTCLCDAIYAADTAKAVDDRSAQAGGVPLVAWNRTLFVFHSQHTNAVFRAERANRRIRALSEKELALPIERKPVVLDGIEGRLLSINSKPLFTVLVTDLDHESGETLESAAAAAAARLREYFDARLAQSDRDLLARGILITAVATFVFLSLQYLLHRLRTRSRRKINAAEDLHRHGTHSLQVDIRHRLWQLLQWFVILLLWGTALIIAYVWAGAVLAQFPYSQPWAHSLHEFVLNILSVLTNGIIRAIPNLVVLFVIVLLTRTFVRISNYVFDGVENRRLEVPWIDPDTSKATRRVAAVLIWIFGLTVAYPYIPGSETDAFKGISVFAGLMISLGSAGVVNQVMSGLMVIFARALRLGEFIKVGETEGTVTEIGFLATKIRTIQQQEISLPNTLVASTHVINYSRLTGHDGLVATTTVSIGYDTPWRQVHALLEMAAARTARLRKDAAPRVLQRGLSDFYVEYILVVRIDRAEERGMALSELHANIQDTFNEYGVQIMSPNFEAQPEKNVIVPKEKWYAQPAAPAQPA